MEKKWKLLVQPENSSSCGQYCIAIITGEHIDNVVSVFGHAHTSRTKELVSALNHFGYATSTKLSRYANHGLPAECILKISWEGKSTGHWVAYSNEVVYDPAGAVLPLSDFISINEQYGGRIASYLEINSQFKSHD